MKILYIRLSWFHRIFQKYLSHSLIFVLLSGFMACAHKTDNDDKISTSKSTVPVLPKTVMHQKVKQPKIIDIKGTSIVDNEIFKLSKISDSYFKTLKKKSRPLKGMVSPDKNFFIVFEEVDPTASSLTINRALTTNDAKNRDEKIKGYFQTEKVLWTNDSSKFAFIDTDLYAYSGDNNLVIINARTAKIIKISLDDFTKNVKTGDREMLLCKYFGWYNNKTLIFSVSINYQGDSGHPGINGNLKQKLGKNFDKDDPIKLGKYMINIK